jgi:multiple sugar transport system substrate-binding protein
VLEKAKVEPPKTFADLVAAAKAVKTDKMGGFFAGNDGGLGVLANMLIWSSGFEQLNSDDSGLGFIESNFFDAVNAYRDFYNSGALLTSASKDWFDGSPFVNGETAMQWTGLWALNDIKKKWGDDFGVLPFPSIGSSGRQAVPFGAYGSCAAAKGTNNNVAVAKDYIKWLWIDQTDKQVDFANSFGTHIPAQPALVSQASQISSGAGKEAADFVDKLGHASGLLWTSTISDSFNAALTNVVKKKADAKSEFAGVQKTAQSELKRIKK